MLMGDGAFLEAVGVLLAGAEAPYLDDPTFLPSLVSVAEQVLSMGGPALVAGAVPIVEGVLRGLGTLLSSATFETQCVALRLFADIALLFVNTPEVYPVAGGAASDALNGVLIQIVVPTVPSLVAAEAPLPVLVLRLLGAVVGANPAFASILERVGLVPLLVSLAASPDRVSVPALELVRGLVTSGELGADAFDPASLTAGLESLLASLAAEAAAGVSDAGDGPELTEAARALLVDLA